MPVLRGFIFWTIFLVVNCVICTSYATEVPEYHGYVNDYAKMISPAQRLQLERVLQSFDLSDSTQIAILTIPSLAGDPIEDFSIRTVNKWQIGRKTKDNGVLLLVAKQDKKIRIEVGKGLEGVLTDLLSGRIIDQLIAPRFKTGQLDEGFSAGIAAIIKATRGEFTADKTSRQRIMQRDEPSPLFKFLFIGFIVVTFLGFISRILGMTIGGILFPLAMLFGLLPFSLPTLFFFIPTGIVGGLLLPIIVAGLVRSGALFSIGNVMIGGGFGRGGNNFGGFGGGGFGGGGASGGW